MVLVSSFIRADAGVKVTSGSGLWYPTEGRAGSFMLPSTLQPPECRLPLETVFSFNISSSAFALIGRVASSTGKARVPRSLRMRWSF